jgi:hypothetical protein
VLNNPVLCTWHSLGLCNLNNARECWLFAQKQEACERRGRKAWPMRGAARTAFGEHEATMDAAGSLNPAIDIIYRKVGSCSVHSKGRG